MSTQPPTVGLACFHHINCLRAEYHTRYPPILRLLSHSSHKTLLSMQLQSIMIQILPIDDGEKELFFVLGVIFSLFLRLIGV